MNKKLDMETRNMKRPNQVNCIKNKDGRMLETMTISMIDGKTTCINIIMEILQLRLETCLLRTKEISSTHNKNAIRG